MNPWCVADVLLPGAAYAVVRLFVFIIVTRRRDIPFVHGAPKSLQHSQRAPFPEVDVQECIRFEGPISLRKVFFLVLVVELGGTDEVAKFCLVQPFVSGVYGFVKGWQLGKGGRMLFGIR